MNSCFNIPSGFLAFLLLILLGGCQSEQRYSTLPAGAVVLAFGDSVTFGTGAASGEDFPTWVAKETGWEVVNAGIPGDTAREAKSRIGGLLERHQPELVLVELGGNDFLRQRPVGQVKKDLREILDRTISSGAITVLVAVPRTSLVRAGIGALADSPIYSELAEETGVVLIEGVFARIVSDSALRADRIHPNAEGYRLFAQGLLEQLRDVGIAP